MFNLDDTIVAPATAPGGALSIIRISGPDSLALCDKIFRSPTGGKNLVERKGYTLGYGTVVYPDGRVLDDVVVSVFRAPNSYTGEDMVEISCHGSRYITAEIIGLLIGAGARAADAGEFTSRAFLAGKLDLSQAEAVADTITSHSRASPMLASTQMRGGYSDDLGRLRDQLLRLGSLLELELDFSEEDVTFADRGELKALMETISSCIEELINSFALGNAIKEGVAVAILGSPNAGKSTLLNTLLNEDRAMVSDIAGTTRDAIEERITLGGVEFRFIDTAGIRASGDALELMGIERTFKAAAGARVILYLFDIGRLTTSLDVNRKAEDKTEGGALDKSAAEIAAEISSAIAKVNAGTGQKICIVLNKCDECDECGSPREDIKSLAGKLEKLVGQSVIPISAKYGHNIGALTAHLTSLVDADPVYGGATIVSNSRHYDALRKAHDALRESLSGLSGGLPSDLIAQDIRQALHWLGTITGEITTDEILSSIFSKFCIGK